MLPPTYLLGRHESLIRRRAGVFEVLGQCADDVIRDGRGVLEEQVYLSKVSQSLGSVYSLLPRLVRLTHSNQRRQRLSNNVTKRN